MIAIDGVLFLMVVVMMLTWFLTAARPSKWQPNPANGSKTWPTAARPSKRQLDLANGSQTWQTAARPSKRQPDRANGNQT